MAADSQLITDDRAAKPHPFEGVMAAWVQFRQNTPTPKSPSLFRRIRRYRVIAFFLLGLVGLDLLLLATNANWRAYDPDDYLERLENCRSRSHDLVIVGGSPVSEGIDPELLKGLSWRGQSVERPFNLGLPGATTSEVWHAVKHGLPTPPRLLVYGITASDVNDSRYEPHGTRSLMDFEDLKDWVRRRPESREWVIRHYAEERAGSAWQLYSNRNAIRMWAADQVAAVFPEAFPGAAEEARKNLRRQEELCCVNGFAPELVLRDKRLDVRRPTGELGQRFAFLDGYCIGGHLKYLHRLLDWAEQNHVSVVLVDMPVPAELDEQMHPQAFVTYRAALREVSQQRRVPLLWANRTATGIGDPDFADRIHLNAQGTARLSSWLRTELAQLER